MNYDKEWYDSLIKPNFQPPAWLFRPVWIFIYILMIISVILLINQPFQFNYIFACLFFVFQLFVNLQWFPAFFKEHNLRKAFLLSVLLTILVFITMVLFFLISKISGILLLPYFLWCCFASILNFHILELNEW